MISFWTTILFISYNLANGANVQLPLGVVFDQGIPDVQAAFKHALMTFTPLNITRYSDRNGDFGERFGFTAYVDTINTADAFKLSKLICTQFSRGIFAMVGAMNSESFQTYHSYSNSFGMPVVVPWYPMKSEKVFESPENPPTPPKMDFAIRMRPDLHQSILDIIDYYGWKNIIIICNEAQALLQLQSLLQRLTITENPLKISAIKKISTVQDAIDVLLDIESAERFSQKYIVLDCPISMAKEIIVAHVRNIHLGRRTYHYLLAGLEENVRACLPVDHTEDQYSSKDTELIVALSLSIAFILIELTTFGSGLTMFSSFTTVYSIMAHALGAILLVYFLTESWDCGLYWWIFSLTVCLPLLFDVVTILVDACAYDAKYK